MARATVTTGGALLALLATLAGAAEFRSVGDSPAVLYDAPSEKANKLYMLSPGYPLEIVVPLEHWSKVRTADGELSWIENQDLGDRRTLLVKVPLAAIRAAPDDGAPTVFQAEQGVLLELLELTDTGWVRVQHRDGQSGYLRVDQVWGL
ncbi:MAG TPA: SH3 domain-containing protein [Burkholderiales bacterium]|nr:SH3 domain-containing protein [Burkholderiales bacterium]